VALLAAGTVGLRVIEDDTWLNCLFMAVITLTTVGYSDIVSLTDAGKVFIMIYLICGVGFFTYGAFSIGQWLVSAQMQNLLRRRRMERRIEQLDNHYIICGSGRMGTTIARFLHERDKPFVVIDINENRLQEVCNNQDWLYVVGDATEDETLLKAGIKRANALTAVLPTDAANVYVVLSARLLAANLQIIARASDEEAGVKMERAGASRIVSPYNSGAIKIARFMLTPSVEDFLEIADAYGGDMQLADVQIKPNSPYAGKKLMETDFREKGIMVIGIRRPNGERLMPPPGTAMINEGDNLFTFGTSNAVNDMIAQTDVRE